MQVILHGKPNALIAIHDFACRPHYFVVRDVAQEIATFENMTIFMRKPDYDPRRAVAILNEHALNPV